MPPKVCRNCGHEIKPGTSHVEIHRSDRGGISSSRDLFSRGSQIPRGTYTNSCQEQDDV